MRLTDNKRTIEITIHTWEPESCSYTPDWAEDFFSAGRLPYDDETDTYTVGSVDACIDQAQDWAAAKGDYITDSIDCSADEIANRSVEVEELTAPSFTLEDIASCMIGNSDHSDITSDHSSCYYVIYLDEDGHLCRKADAAVTLDTYAEISDDCFDGIDMEALDAGDMDEIDAFLGNFDDCESLDDECFRAAAEEMYERACKEVQSL